MQGLRESRVARMATTVKQAKSTEYANFDEYVDFQLNKTRKNIKSTDILTALAGVAALTIGYLLAFVVLDHWVIADGFGRATRILMLLGFILAAIAWILWMAVRPYFKRITNLYAAKAIESSASELQSNLLNLVDLQRTERDVSERILNSIEKRAAVALSHVDVDQAVDRQPLMRASYALLAVVVLLCLYTVFSPKKIAPSIWHGRAIR